MQAAVPRRYQDRFQHDHAVRAYQEEVYAPGGYDDFIWSLQQGRLRRAVEGAFPDGPDRYLDFACGTGRILSFLEPSAKEATGLDISPAMAEVARSRAGRAEVRVGDLLRTPGLLSGRYDLVTAFRYFLNTDPELRLPVLRALSERLRDERSLLIFNVHGHSRSVRHLSVRYHAARGRTHPELSAREAFELADAAGLRVEEVHGFGVCPRSLHSVPLMGGVVRALDAGAARIPAAWRVSVDLMLVCRRKEAVPRAEALPQAG